MPNPETIAWLKHTASCGQASSQLMLEVLERLERLEAAQLEPIDEAARRPPAGLSLLDEVAWAIGNLGDETLNWRPEARRAVAVIARRLRERNTIVSSEAAGWLEREAIK